MRRFLQRVSPCAFGAGLLGAVLIGASLMGPRPAGAAGQTARPMGLSAVFNYAAPHWIHGVQSTVSGLAIPFSDGGDTTAASAVSEAQPASSALSAQSSTTALAVHSEAIAPATPASATSSAAAGSSGSRASAVVFLGDTDPSQKKERRGGCGSGRGGRISFGSSC